jgi:hypothetical protein
MTRITIENKWFRSFGSLDGFDGNAAVTGKRCVWLKMRRQATPPRWFSMCWFLEIESAPSAVIDATNADKVFAVAGLCYVCGQLTVPVKVFSATWPSYYAPTIRVDKYWRHILRAPVRNDRWRQRTLEAATRGRNKIKSGTDFG